MIVPTWWWQRCESSCRADQEGEELPLSRWGAISRIRCTFTGLDLLSFMKVSFKTCSGKEIKKRYQLSAVGSLSLSLWKFPSKLVQAGKEKRLLVYCWSIAIEGLTRRWRLGPSWSGRRRPRWSRCAPWPWPPWTWAQGVELNWIDKFISKICTSSTLSWIEMKIILPPQAH